ncbi:MAG: redoxin family protein [Alphaproteobacteria bacterium]|nr:redoxin family protein [Alphaproteobacteria bacterium]
MYKTAIIFVIVLAAGFYSSWIHFLPRPSNTAFQNDIRTLEWPASFSFSFETIEGKEVSLESLKGKTILINVWATWCAPCIIEFPDLLKLAAKNPERIVLVAMSVDQNKNDIDQFLKSLPEDVIENLALENVYIAHDPLKEISRDIMRITLYPETFILKPNLDVDRKLAGIQDWLGSDIAQIIEEHHSNE